MLAHVTTMRRAGLAAALALLALLPGCLSYDTCDGSTCGTSCWICSTWDPDECGTREPDGVCDDDHECQVTGFPTCR